MKLILSAITLTFAVPAAAQTAPAVDHSQHSPAQHAQHAQHGAGHDGHKGGHEGHGKDAKHECPMSKDGKKMACCEHKKGECTMAKDGKKMTCCDHDAHGKADAKAHADHGGH
jgi:hypothetical protein